MRTGPRTRAVLTHLGDRSVLVAAVALVTVALAGVGVVAPTPPAGAAPVDCAEAGSRLTLTADAVLDASCTWAGIDIVASGVTLDCAGATIDGTGQSGRGIAVVAPADTALTDVTIRRCHTEGFLNGIRVTRTGFRDLVPGKEYDATTARITIEDSSVADSRGVGIFVDAYVSDVTLRAVEVRGAGSTGVYLEAGSRRNRVLDSRLSGNGFRENGPEGQLVSFAGTTFRFWGRGREGLAVDGSRQNVITGNTIEGNAAGGIFLYENCGEYATSRPEAWWERRTGAEDNLIEDNAISGGETGVWIGSRMSQNTLPMDCSAPAYREGPAERYVLDHAARTAVRGNRIGDVTYGVRVEDDDAVIEGNTFSGSDASQHAVIVGTRVRTEELGRPVHGTVLAGNTSRIVGNLSPYRWTDGQDASVLEGNTALGVGVGWCEAPTVPTAAFIFVEHLVVEDPAGPPTPKPDDEVATLGALAACPTRASAPTGPPTTTEAPSPAATPVAGAATFAG